MLSSCALRPWFLSVFCSVCAARPRPVHPRQKCARKSAFDAPARALSAGAHVHVRRTSTGACILEKGAFPHGAPLNESASEEGGGGRERSKSARRRRRRPAETAFDAPSSPPSTARVGRPLRPRKGTEKKGGEGERAREGGDEGEAAREPECGHVAAKPKARALECNETRT